MIENNLFVFYSAIQILFYEMVYNTTSILIILPPQVAQQKQT